MILGAIGGVAVIAAFIVIYIVSSKTPEHKRVGNESLAAEKAEHERAVNAEVSTAVSNARANRVIQERDTQRAIASQEKFRKDHAAEVDYF